MSSCTHLVNVALVGGHSVQTQFKLLRSVCSLKERDPALRAQMNAEQGAQLEPQAQPDDCPFAARGDFSACRWHRQG
ncbi:MAG: hypothetical protein QM723_29255 [Myxococcaceae bacterium]